MSRRSVFGPQGLQYLCGGFQRCKGAGRARSLWPRAADILEENA